MKRRSVRKDVQLPGARAKKGNCDEKADSTGSGCRGCAGVQPAVVQRESRRRTVCYEPDYRPGSAYGPTRAQQGCLRAGCGQRGTGAGHRGVTRHQESRGVGAVDLEFALGLPGAEMCLAAKWMRFRSRQQQRGRGLRRCSQSRSMVRPRCWRGRPQLGKSSAIRTRMGERVPTLVLTQLMKRAGQ
jgi:hypothetical protein